MQWNKITVDLPNYREIRINYEPEGEKKRFVVLRSGEHIEPEQFQIFRAYREDVMLQKLLLKSVEAEQYFPFEPQQLVEWRKVQNYEHVLRTMFLYQKLRALLEGDFRTAVDQSLEAVQ